MAVPRDAVVIAATGWNEGLTEHFGGGPKWTELQLGLSRAPFTWRVLDQVHPMELLGGFVGVAQDQETLTVRPAIGWAVRDERPGPVLRMPELPRRG